MANIKGVKMKRITLSVSQKEFDLLSALGTVENVIQKLVDHAAQGVRRPGAWERGWLMQAFGDEFEEKIEQDPATHGRHYIWFRTIGTDGVEET